MFADRDYIIHPYMVDDHLQRKKKQPKYITKAKLKPLNYQNELIRDWFFMKICQGGGLNQWRNHTNNMKCRFLHHQDPYLKLGPFKVLSL